MANYRKAQGRVYQTKAPFNVAMKLLIPTESLKKGTTVKTFDEENAPTIYGTFRTFGGTELVDNGVMTIIDTATISTWYRPDITAECRIKVLQTGEVYDIIGTPENIAMRNQFLQFKVRKAGGKA